MFNEAKRKHEQSFAESGKAINEKVRLYVRVGHALIDARQKGLDPYSAIEAVVAWDRFTQSVDEAERLAEPESFEACGAGPLEPHQPHRRLLLAAEQTRREGRFPATQDSA
jgi:hypothetical protein